ncbi:uncharacterized protein FOMMEDRAFT_153451 [Fomitiporia mediterranea MF3/22]|uniref:uncharacterized protein n=1 Tax=Fomitiporia mediterranea (strain MF3/22) TaxID=694068 RepID=UPI00044092B1|nr:uncharacterized protein FOMMEDRAFT_153451 [Fomitiporia mediterranea MF3/22]EJD06089.1 hypothetical protein FOMMEDRAFT_153451 [Fomitiporia mediterranea MF3/22]
MANATLDYGYAHTFHVRSDPEYVDPSLVPLFASEDVTQKYFAVAMLTVLVYNAFTNMDKEIRYFWVSLIFVFINPWLMTKQSAIRGALQV